MKWLLARILAGLTLAGLCWWLVWSGWPELAVGGLLFAALGGVVARPGKAKRFRPDTWRREVTIPRGD